MFIIADILFFKYNSPGMANLGFILALSQPLVVFSSFLLIFYAIQNLIILWHQKPEYIIIDHPLWLKIRQSPIWVGINIISSVGLVILFLNLVLLNYYQPLALYDNLITFLAICWGTFAIKLLFSGIFFLIEIFHFRKKTPDSRVPNPRLSEGIIISFFIWLLFFPSYLLIDQINQPQLSEGLNSVYNVYQKKMEDYYTFRIPSMVIIPKGSILNNTDSVDDDLILTFAEGRQNNVLDTGAIDTVMRRSLNGGDNWEPLQIINRWPKLQERIKFGNPTVVYDNYTGTLFLSYSNMSRLNGEFFNFYRVSRDGGESWGSPMQLNTTAGTIMGPGHGIQLHDSPNKGRLILPAHDSYGCYSVFSDDHGQSWQYGSPNGYGNENEVMALDNGTLYMSVRSEVSCASTHPNYDRLYSLSQDGGESWSYPKMHQFLPDPIVMGSVIRANSNLTSPTSYYIHSLPASYTSRVKMTLYVSDNAQTWNISRMVYVGPSGYSELGLLSDGSIGLLFERGRAEYSNLITWVNVDLDWINIIP